MDDAAEAEFSEFMQSRWPQLVPLGYGLTGDEGLAKDLAQTALARLCLLAADRPGGVTRMPMCGAC